MTDESQRMAYIARKPCGCIVGASADISSLKKETAKDVAEWIRKGYTVERVTAQYVRDNWNECPHAVKQAKLELGD